MHGRAQLTSSWRSLTQLYNSTIKHFLRTHCRATRTRNELSSVLKSRGRTRRTSIQRKQKKLEIWEMKPLRMVSSLKL